MSSVSRHTQGPARTRDGERPVLVGPQHHRAPGPQRLHGARGGMPVDVVPAAGDERDRAKFAKARSYMVRRDDLVACKNVRCRKRFEVSGVQSVAFLDEQVKPPERLQ